MSPEVGLHCYKRLFWTCFAVSHRFWASLVTQVVKNLPAIQETWVRSLAWDDPCRRERLPTPVFLLGERRTEEPGGLQSIWGYKEWDVTERLTLSFSWILESCIFVLRYFLISFFISLLSHGFFSSLLFTLCVFGFFPIFLNVVVF